MNVLRGAVLGFVLVARDRRVWPRYALLVVATTLSGVVLLIASAVPGAAQDRLAVESARAGQAQPPSAAGDSPGLLVRPVEDRFRGLRIARHDVAATSEAAPVPPGAAALPAPGEVVLSPQMRAARVESPELRDRYPGRVVGEIGAPGLAYADELVAYVGRAPEQLAGNANPIRDFALRDGQFVPLPSGLLTLAVAGSLAVLGPFVLLVAAATRFTSRVRARRLAALDLVGAPAGARTGALVGEAGALAVVGAVGALLLAQPAGALASLLLPPDLRVPVGSMAPDALSAVVVAVSMVGVAVLCAVQDDVEQRSAVVSTLRRAARPARRRVPRATLAGLLVLFTAVPLRPAVLGAGGDTGPLFVLLPAGLVLVLGGLPRTVSSLSDAVAGRLARRGGASRLLGGSRLSWQRAGGQSTAALTSVLLAAAGFLLGVTPAFSDARVQSAGPAVAGLSRDVVIGTAEDAANLGPAGAAAGATTVDTVPARTEDGASVFVLVTDCGTLGLALVAPVADYCEPGLTRLLSRDGVALPSGVTEGRLTLVDQEGTDAGLLPPMGNEASPPAFPTELGFVSALAMVSSSDVPPEVLRQVSVRTAIALPLEGQDVEAARTRLAEVGVTAARTAQEVEDDAVREIAVYRHLLLVATALAVTTVLFSAATATIASAQERRREASGLHALGAPRHVAGTAFMVEAAVPLLAAVAAGLCGGLFLGTYYLLYFPDLVIAGPLGGYDLLGFALLAGTSAGAVAAIAVLSVLLASRPVPWGRDNH